MRSFNATMQCLATFSFTYLFVPLTNTLIREGKHAGNGTNWTC